MAQAMILLIVLTTIVATLCFPQYNYRWHGNHNGQIVDPGFAGPTGSTGGVSGVDLVDPGFGGPRPTGSWQGNNGGVTGVDLVDPGFGGPRPTGSWQGNNGGIIDPGFAGPGTPGRYTRRYY